MGKGDRAAGVAAEAGRVGGGAAAEDPAPRAPTAVASATGSATTTARDPTTPRMVKMGPSSAFQADRRRWKSGASMSAVWPTAHDPPPGAAGSLARTARRDWTVARARAKAERARESAMAIRAVKKVREAGASMAGRGEGRRGGRGNERRRTVVRLGRAQGLLFFSFSQFLQPRATLAHQRRRSVTSAPPLSHRRMLRAASSSLRRAALNCNASPLSAFRTSVLMVGPDAGAAHSGIALAATAGRQGMATLGVYQPELVGELGRGVSGRAGTANESEGANKR